MPSAGRLFRCVVPTAVTVALVLTAAPAASAMPHPFVPVEAPEVAGLTADPGTVNVSAEAASVAVAAHVTDPGGVASVALRLGSAAAVPLALTSGYAVDGTWTGVVTVPAFTPFGDLLAHVDAVGVSGAVVTSTLPSVTVADAVPAAPASITADAADDGALRVVWTEPVANGGSAVESYDVTATPAAGGEPIVSALGAEARSVTLTGLADAARYVVRVAAHNAAGAGAPAVADATTAVGDVTEPDAPTSVVVTPADRALNVSWYVPASAGGTAVTGYEVRATPAVAGVAVPPAVPVAAGTTSARVPGLLNGVAYDVGVVAVNAVGRSLPGLAGGTPRTVPGAPVIDGVFVGDARAVVRWTAPDDDGGAAIESFAIKASSGGTVVNVPADARRAPVTKLPNGVPTTFSVVAVNAAGSSAADVSAAVTPRKPGRLVVVTPPAAKVRYGSTTGVGAALVDSAGAGIAGQPVELLAKVVPSTTWRRVAYGTTGSTGRLVLRATLPANAALRLHHPPTSVGAPDVTVRSVAVAPRVSAAVSDTRVRVGQPVTVRGGIVPAHAAGSGVLLQRYSSGAWRTLATGRMTSTTTYRVTFTPGTVNSNLMRVVKASHADHAAGKSPAWRQVVDPENAADIARDIRDDRGVSLETTHDSGIADRANPRQNIVDVADGRLARRSAYQNAPGGYTTLDRRMLRALRWMGLNGSITVSEIAGGSHSRGSTHYYGRGLDISWVNGVHVSPSSDYGLAVRACRLFGAVRVFHPRYDPVGGHSRHVHCDWA